MISASAILLAAMLLPSADAPSPFAFREVNGTGLELSEGGQPVYVYNFGMILGKDLPESMRRSSYLHPVYAPGGIAITDDFNPNHPHHRGIFWAWTDITVDGKKGDMWTVKGPYQDRFVAWKARTVDASSARLAVENGWFDGERKFLKEEVEIIAQRAVDARRVLKFTLRLEATDKPVQIVGTAEGKKGFSGFCFKFAAPDGGKPVISTDEGVAAKDGVLARHPWAQLAGTFHGQPAGARVDDDPANPGYPRNGWLMRHQLCCLNVSYPGLEPITLAPGKPLTLKYTVTLFAGTQP
jgi:hypothetical protein